MCLDVKYQLEMKGVIVWVLVCLMNFEGSFSKLEYEIGKDGILAFNNKLQGK